MYLLFITFVRVFRRSSVVLFWLCRGGVYLSTIHIVISPVSYLSNYLHISFYSSLQKPRHKLRNLPPPLHHR
jgi:hypothetical protein